jgi:hypothetical protein
MGARQVKCAQCDRDATYYVKCSDLLYELVTIESMILDIDLDMNDPTFGAKEKYRPVEESIGVQFHCYEVPSTAAYTDLCENCFCESLKPKDLDVYYNKVTIRKMRINDKNWELKIIHRPDGLKTRDLP